MSTTTTMTTSTTTTTTTNNYLIEWANKRHSYIVCALPAFIYRCWSNRKTSGWVWYSELGLCFFWCRTITGSRVTLKLVHRALNNRTALCSFFFRVVQSHAHCANGNGVRCIYTWCSYYVPNWKSLGFPMCANVLLLLPPLGRVKRRPIHNNHRRTYTSTSIHPLCTSSIHREMQSRHA